MAPMRAGDAEGGSGADRPLAGVRVVDAVDGPLAAIARQLGELGAAVDRIDAGEPADPIADLAFNTGKRRCGPEALDAPAHIVIADMGCRIDLEGLRARDPRLVTMRVSDFGERSALDGWRATEPVLLALSGELSRSGIKGRPPLLPPGELAYQCAATQAAFALVASLYHALRTGRGAHLDFAALEGAAQALDPGYGIGGSATMGRPAHLLSRDRPTRGFLYPIIPCADGHVRLCVLSKRQWRGMFNWLGEPEAFASPAFDSIAARHKSPDLLPAIAAMFASRTRAELEAEAQAHGVPLAGLNAFEEFIASDHLRARGALVEVATAAGSTLLPNGVVTVDGTRMGPGTDAAEPRFPAPAVAAARPFEGLRVLDLGVIVVGAEQGRLFADLGADVVKVESGAYPDGNRQSYLSYGLSNGFAAGHRNKRGLGLNLRDPRGRQLFLRLAATADVILSNFKPGTLDALGLGYREIAAVNPRVICVGSSAFGSTGPWSGRMGYGPLVRAASGLTRAWRYPDDARSFSDSVTVYPDHTAARVGATAAAALLVRRLGTDRGGTADVSQAEAMLAQFAPEVARLSRGLPVGAPPDWPWGPYRAAGEDEWCVVTVRNDADWRALRAVVDGMPGRLETAADRLGARERIDEALGAWMRARDPHEAAAMLQAGGVPAAPMLRVADQPDHPWFRERGLYRVERHPYLAEDVLADGHHVRSPDIPPPDARPAPLVGEHSAAVVQDWLGLPDSEMDTLIADGVLEPVDPDTLAQARAAVGT